MRVSAITAELVVALPVAAAAEPPWLRLGWDDMREVASHAEIAPRVTIWLDPDGERPIKGRLKEITGGGIALGKRTRARFIPRDEVHTVRLVPVKGERFQGHPHRWRIVAAIAAVPVWLFTYTAGLAAGGARMTDCLPTATHGGASPWPRP